MPIPVTSNFVPRPGQNYALLEDIYLRGGLRVVDRRSDLDDPEIMVPSTLKIGMLAFVRQPVEPADDRELDRMYQLAYIIDEDPENPILEWKVYNGASFRGDWDPAQEYVAGDVVVNNYLISGEGVKALWYAAGDDTGQEPKPGMDGGDWIKIGPNNFGEDMCYAHTWVDTDTYAQGAVVHHLDKYWLALSRTSNHEPSQGEFSYNTWALIGRDSAYDTTMLFIGEFVSGKSYAQGSVVHHQGILWFAPYEVPSDTVEPGGDGDNRWMRCGLYDTSGSVPQIYYDAWSNNATYMSQQIVSHNGGLWICTSDDTYQQEPGVGDGWQLMVQGGGGGGFNFKGEWQAGTNYSKGDCVTYGNALWTATVDTSGAIEPGGNGDWQKVINEGTQGPKGDQGDPGPEGPQGPKGDAGAPGEGLKFGASGLMSERYQYDAEQPGFTFFDATTGGVYTRNGAEGMWLGPAYLGERGEQGERGIEGPKGDQGDPGLQGPPGVPGLFNTGAWSDATIYNDVGAVVQYQGAAYSLIESPAQGNSDIPGVSPKWSMLIDRGAKGDKGDRGEQGLPGNDGAKGEQGDIGPEGPKGDQGDPGPEGPQGPKGDTGESGATAPHASTHAKGGSDELSPAAIGAVSDAGGTIGGDLNVTGKLLGNTAYANLAGFPAAAGCVGTVAKASDTGLLYVSNGDNWLQLAEGGGPVGDLELPYDFAFYAPAVGNPTEVIGAFIVNREVTILALQPNARIWARTAPSANLTLALFLNEGQVGTISIAGGAFQGTVNITEDILLAPGNFLSIRTGSSGDPGLRDLMVTMTGWTNVTTGSP